MLSRRVVTALTTIALATAVLTPSTVGTAAAATASDAAPQVIPTLDHWTASGGGLTWANRNRVVVTTPSGALTRTAQTFSDDLVASGRVRPAVTSGGTRAGDVALAVVPGRRDLGAEGYELTVGDRIRITAATDTGAFYGTRTVLQLLATSDRIPRGHVVDVPSKSERGLELCACEIKISVPVVERMIADMAYVKLNWLLVPLKMKSTTHPETNTWSYYTRAEVQELVAQAKRYHVTLVPEINSPGHMDPFLINRPDLQLTDRNGVRSPARLDLTSDAAFRFYTDLLDEYAGVFTNSPYWMLGADEYLLGSAYSEYPQIGEYAKKTYGADAQPADAYLGFINKIDDHVRRLGLKLRIWNDGLPKQSVVQVNRDVLVQYWIPDELSPQDILDRGHQLMNSSSTLYNDRGSRPSPHNLCPSAPTLAECLPTLWADGWNAGRFEDGSQLSPADPRITGAHISTWMGEPDAATEAQEQETLFLPFRFLAQRLWSRTDAFESWSAFAARANALGRAPGWNSVDYRPLPDGTYTITPSGSSSSLTTPTPTDDAVLSLGSRPEQWQLRHTDDGYYRVVSSATGRCLTMPLPPGLELLRGEPNVGEQARFAACADTDNLQKWEITRTRGGLAITNAVSRLSLDVTDDGAVQQLVPDRSGITAWRFTSVARATLTLTAAAELLKAGEANTVSAAFTNTGAVPVTGLTVSLTAPTGWTVRRSGPPSYASIAPRASVTVKFTVTPAVDASSSTSSVLSARASYTVGRRAYTVDTAAVVRINPIRCATPGSSVGPDDDFDGTALDGCRWSAVQDPDLSALSVGDGALSITTGSSDLAGPGGSIRNLVLQPAPSGDVTITTRMSAPLNQSYQQAGPLLWSDDDNYTELVLVAGNAAGSPPSYYLSLVSEQGGQFARGGVSNFFLPADTPSGDWYLRLTRHGDTITGSYSRDGATWTDMPATVSNTSLSAPKMGVQACGPLQQQPVTVAFDSFTAA